MTIARRLIILVAVPLRPGDRPGSLQPERDGEDRTAERLRGPEAGREPRHAGEHLADARRDTARPPALPHGRDQGGEGQGPRDLQRRQGGPGPADQPLRGRPRRRRQGPAAAGRVRHAQLPVDRPGRQVVADRQSGRREEALRTRSRPLHELGEQLGKASADWIQYNEELAAGAGSSSPKPSRTPVEDAPRRGPRAGPLRPARVVDLPEDRPPRPRAPGLRRVHRPGRLREGGPLQGRPRTRPGPWPARWRS